MAFDALGFNWTTQEYVTRSFDERINDLHKYKQMHGHFILKIHEDRSLYQFCADVRYSLKQVEKDGREKLTEERIAMMILASIGEMHSGITLLFEFLSKRGASSAKGNEALLYGRIIFKLGNQLLFRRGEMAVCFLALS